MMAAEERFILMVTFTVIHLIAVKILLKTNRLTLTNGEGLSQPSVDTHTHTHTHTHTEYVVLLLRFSSTTLRVTDVLMPQTPRRNQRFTQGHKGVVQ